MGGSLVIKSLPVTVWLGQIITVLWANLFISKMEIIIITLASWGDWRVDGSIWK